MIEHLHIDGFRGLDDLDIQPLGQLNLIIGAGNSGKTNLLEALFIFCSNGDPKILYKVLALRGVVGDALSPDVLAGLTDWFWSADGEERGCVIEGDWDGSARSVRLERIRQGSVIPFGAKSDGEHPDPIKEAAQPVSTIRIKTVQGEANYTGEFRIKSKDIEFDDADAPNLQGRFLSVDTRGKSYGLASQWSSVLESGQAEPVVKLLQAFDSDIKDVALRSDGSGRAYLRIDHKSLGFMPVEMQGAGVGKALAIASYLVDTANGMLMIDEIESSLHVGVLERVIKFTLQAAKKHNVQLFASTHSLETLDAFLDAYEDMSDLYSSKEDFRILQLKREGGRAVVTNLDAEEARRMRDNLGLDLRRT